MFYFLATGAVAFGAPLLGVPLFVALATAVVHATVSALVRFVFSYEKSDGEALELYEKETKEARKNRQCLRYVGLQAKNMVLGPPRSARAQVRDMSWFLKPNKKWMAEVLKLFACIVHPCDQEAQDETLGGNPILKVIGGVCGGRVQRACECSLI